MRLLAAADLHGVLGVYEWLARVAGEQQADLVVLAGDLLAGDWEDGQRKQVAKIIPLLKKVPAPVLYFMGNDDSVALDYEDEQIRPFHGMRVDCGGFNFVGYQYSLPFMGGVFEKPEYGLEEDLRALEPLLDSQTVLVTHSPAFGFLDMVAGGQRVGSRSLAALLERRSPLAHVHGHIHECFGRSGNRFNVASAGLRRAVLIELPSLGHQALEAR